MIRILMVEDNAVVRQIMKEMVSKQVDLEVTGTAENGLIALDLLKKGLIVDIVLADLNMKGMDGIELTKNITALYSNLSVIILTMHDKSAYLRRAMAAGAKGYLLKNGDMDEVYTALRSVYGGQTVVSSGIDD